MKGKHTHSPLQGPRPAFPRDLSGTASAWAESSLVARSHLLKLWPGPGNCGMGWGSVGQPWGRACTGGGDEPEVDGTDLWSALWDGGERGWETSQEVRPAGSQLQGAPSTLQREIGAPRRVPCVPGTEMEGPGHTGWGNTGIYVASEATGIEGVTRGGGGGQVSGSEGRRRQGAAARTLRVGAALGS